MNKQQEKLIKSIETRLRTIMIGSLSRIEESLGYLWNHGDEPQNSKQEDFADKWENLRAEILNHGNHQIRSSIDELYNFFESENRYDYKYNFTFNKKDRR